MTALSAIRDTEKLVGDPIPARVGRGAATDVLYKGGMAAINAAGYLAPAGLAVTDVVVGRFVDTYSNGGSPGAITAEAEQGVFRWANGDAIAITDLGKPCYALDDATVTKGDGGSSRPFAGIIADVDSEGVWVMQGLYLQGLLRDTYVQIASKAVGFADASAAGTTKTIDFAAALPAGAMVLGAGANVTAVFDNVGDTADVTFDLGIKSGDTDAFVDAGELNAVAKVSIPRGTGVPALVGGITPSIIIDGSVNLDTLTKGAAVFYVAYVEAF
jgi:hypothetical protein